MVQKYYSGEISHEPILLGLNTKQERNYETITLSSCISVINYTELILSYLTSESYLSELTGHTSEITQT
jgi:hypothetical protein